MENVLLDRSSGSFEFPKRDVYGGGGGCRRPARPRGAYGPSRTCPQYHHVQKGGEWSSTPAPVLPYGARPPIYSSPSLPLLPSNQPPLLPLPPTATKYATFPYPPPAPPRTGGRPAATATVPAAAAVSSGQRDWRRKPVRPPLCTEPARAQKKKPLERATPLPPAQVVAEALDDLEQEVARSFVQDLLHALAPPPSSLPLPRFSLVMKASPSATASKVAAPAAPSCNAEAATADGLRRPLRL